MLKVLDDGPHRNQIKGPRLELELPVPRHDLHAQMLSAVVRRPLRAFIAYRFPSAVLSRLHHWADRAAKIERASRPTHIRCDSAIPAPKPANAPIQGSEVISVAFTLQCLIGLDIKGTVIDLVE